MIEEKEKLKELIGRIGNLNLSQLLLLLLIAREKETEYEQLYYEKIRTIIDNEGKGKTEADIIARTSVEYGLKENYKAIADIARDIVTKADFSL